mmetsp:Transcript_14670/g.61980  ORF Transcript_14670/g.61980 Transcript_14670/m.61980 type:complete len:219 (-) Transcript_14670:349-1005(-)
MDSIRARRSLATKRAGRRLEPRQRRRAFIAPIVTRGHPTGSHAWSLSLNSAARHGDASSNPHPRRPVAATKPRSSMALASADPPPLPSRSSHATMSAPVTTARSLTNGGHAGNPANVHASLGAIVAAICAHSRDSLSYSSSLIWSRIWIWSATTVEPVSGVAPFASLTAARIARGTGPPSAPAAAPPPSSLAARAPADATAAGKSPSAMPASTSSAPP